MGKLSKKQKAIAEKLDSAKTYSVEEGVDCRVCLSQV